MATSASKKSGPADWSKTFGYVGVAVACVAVTGMANVFSRPAKIEEFGKVGQEFYPQFSDPTLASALEVFVFDNEEVRARDFKVGRNEQGLWVIPSHHDYPADAEERLAKTASSIIGIDRGAMVTRWNADHGRYGVINPKQDSLGVDEVEGVGKRLILRKDDDSVLADFVIGKQVEGKTDEYYVRRPDEDEVYIAKLAIDLSTRFTDWIEDKLFDFSSGDVVQLDINDYVFDDRTVTESIVTNLSREEAWGNNWDLEGLNTETQEIDTTKVNDVLTALSDLTVVGVRPKQKGLTPELTLDREYLRMQAQLDLLQQDLFTRGFALQPGATPDAFSLISREGELIAGTEDGLRYQLYFGRVFTGTEEELEIGLGEAKDDEADAAEGDGAANADADEADASGKPGRYLFVRVAFDESLLSGPKSAPIEPEKPERLRELEAQELEAEKEADAQGDKEEAAETDDEAGAADSEDGEEEPSELETLREAYETAREQYETDLRDYESRQEKIKEGQEKAEEFNVRFANWYYVVPGESFEKLDVARADLIKMKEAEEGEEAADEAASATPPFVPPVGAEEALSSGDETAPTVNDEPEATADTNDATEEVSSEEGASEESASEESASEESASEESASEESASEESGDGAESATSEASDPGE